MLIIFLESTEQLSMYNMGFWDCGIFEQSIEQTVEGP